MSQVLRVGIVGLGTVGRGTLALLQENADDISRRLGAQLQISQVAIRSPKPELDSALSSAGIKFARDHMALVGADDVDIVVEAIGGVDDAFALVKQALLNGKHVVTANKALIALRGTELLKLAQQQGVQLAFEAAVAGGIPILKTLREGLAANQIDWLAGIINGTSNYILTAMEDEGTSFAPTLAEAQALGYAEADPTFDVDGIDAAHKLTILASCAFGVPLNFEQVQIEGIRSITLDDLRYAQDLGYTVKHLGIAKRTNHGVDLKVYPTLVPNDNILAQIKGVMNAVLVHGNGVGPTCYTGAGAGARPTGSSVVADIIEVARGIINGQPAPALGFGDLIAQPSCDPAHSMSSFYLRMTLSDEVGALAAVTRILADAQVSVEAMLQKQPRLDGNRPIATLIILTHEIAQASLNEALAALQAAEVILSDIMVMQMEHFASD